jgi:hypothetical protein
MKAAPEPQCRILPAEIGRRIFVGVSIALLTALSFGFCPGHFFLIGDTQIYIPMLEHLWDPSILARDIDATMPLFSYTLYDETALLLRWITGLGFQEVLTPPKFVFDALRILGVYLIARALKLTISRSLLVAAIFSLGASVVGAMNSSIEWEPIPRTFSFPLVLLAIGLMAHGRDLAATILVSIGFLYHPPTVYPFWVIYLCLTFFPTQTEMRKRRLWGFVPLVCAALLLLLSSHFQAGVAEQQHFFSRLDPQSVEVQRDVSVFNWVSMWQLRWFEHHFFLWIASLIACWRIRRRVSRELGFFLWGLPLIGMLAIPVTYLLLDRLKWSFIPQFQPMRALVFVPIVAVIAGAVAGMQAIEERKYPEGLLWFILVYAIPTEPRVLHVLWPRLSEPHMWIRTLLALLLASLACIGIWGSVRGERGSTLVLATAILLPYFILPTLGNVNKHPRLETPELDHLAGWARSSTPKDAVFLFPDAGKELYPGIFRGRALRAVYVDWFMGLQSIYFLRFRDAWRSRWQAAMATPFDPRNLDRYRRLDVDYLVVKRGHRVIGERAVFENAQFVVYARKNN